MRILLKPMDTLGLLQNSATTTTSTIVSNFMNNYNLLDFRATATVSPDVVVTMAFTSSQRSYIVV